MLKTDGLPGPVIVKRLGKPFANNPKYILGPSSHLLFRVWLFVPMISIFFSAPVIASNPVANTIASTSYSYSPTLMPFSVIESIFVSLTSIRFT